MAFGRFRGLAYTEFYASVGSFWDCLRRSVGLVFSKSNSGVACVLGAVIQYARGSKTY